MKTLAATLLFSILLVGTARADEPADALAQSYQLELKKDYAGAAKALARAPRTQYFVALRLGYLDALAGDARGAADAYRAAAALAPGALEPLLGEQLAQQTLGAWPEAIAAGKKIIALDPANYLGRSRLAWALYKHREFGDSAASYRAVLALYPGDVEMRLGLGWALLGATQKAEAAQAFRDVLAMVPKHASATEGLAAATK